MRGRRIFGIIRRNWYLSSTKIEKMLDVTFWPGLDLFLWTFVSFFLKDMIGSDAFLAMFVGGIFLWMIFLRVGQDQGVFLLEDFWNRSMHHLFISPITAGELAMAGAITALIRVAFMSVFLLVFTAILLQVQFLQLDWVSMALLYIPLIVAGWGIGFFLVGFMLRKGDQYQTLVWALPWILQPFSCVFYPLSSLPPIMQWISRMNPLTYVFEGLRAAQSGGSIWHHFGIALAGASVLFALGAAYYGTGVAASRKSGLLARS